MGDYYLRLLWVQGMNRSDGFTRRLGLVILGDTEGYFCFPMR